MNLPYLFKTRFRKITGIKEEINLKDSADHIRGGIWFRGMNIWILACAIVIASVGLNVNSTAVIIGAMLISPVMGPIIGLGLAIGTNDTMLMKAALKNLVIMVSISLAASTAYFIISPLSLADPTELQARTSPTIYDVFIAFFGGLAGILATSSKSRATVIAGVAIATALMPPLCTAGYGLSSLNLKYFGGAMYLFLINASFITLATYIGVKSLHYPKIQETGNNATARRRRNFISAVFAILLVPSIISAYTLILENNFTSKARNFVLENRLIGKTYIFDYSIVKDSGVKLLLHLAGEPLKESGRKDLLQNAMKAGIDSTQILLSEGAVGISGDEMQDMIQRAAERTDQSILARDAYIEQLRMKVEALDSALTALTAKPDSLAAAPSDSLEVK